MRCGPLSANLYRRALARMAGQSMLMSKACLRDAALLASVFLLLCTIAVGDPYGP